jgi:hypothetical protein
MNMTVTEVKLELTAVVFRRSEMQSPRRYRNNHAGMQDSYITV